MKATSTLAGERLTLRALDPADASPGYLRWLHDPAVTQYLEVRFDPPKDLTALRHYIAAVADSDNSILWGIYLRDGDRLVGTIKLSALNRHHERADIGLLIGDRTIWGQGIATEAIRLVVGHAFGALRLKKLCAGLYSANEGSRRAFLKAGFVEEARQSGQWNFNGDRLDQVWLGRSNHDWLPNRSFGHVRQVALIGGGTCMPAVARAVASAGLGLTAVVAPRHATERMPDGKTLVERFEHERVDFQVIADIETVSNPPAAGPNGMALCLGPAWIFPAAVRAAYGAGMFNLNLIPLPSYLGGAHSTWQIMNANKQGGVFFQEITEALDRGPVLREHLFSFPQEARTPLQYGEANARELIAFVRQLLADIRSGLEFPVRSFSDFDGRRLYFPRLITRENGWIDWSWNAAEIQRFCDAFDSPYPGAGTFLGAHELRLLAVGLETDDINQFHPYTSGLIVRKYRNSVWVAARGGLLRVRRMLDTDGNDALGRIAEGMRLITPYDKLQHARSYRPKITPQTAQ